MFEHEITACRETDTLIHTLLSRAGDAPPYSTDVATAKTLAKEIGLEVIPMHEPNHTHFFAAWGILPEDEPIGYLGFLEGEPTDEGDNLLLMHGWHSLSQAETLPLAVCRSLLVKAEIVVPSRVLMPTSNLPTEA